MPSLIYIAPDTAHYALAPDKYTALVAKLKTDPNARNLTCTVANAGSVQYQKITFAWIYDGIAQLTVKIVADGNWKAKLAGNEVVFQHLDSDLISQV